MTDRSCVQPEIGTRRARVAVSSRLGLVVPLVVFFVAVPLVALPPLDLHQWGCNNYHPLYSKSSQSLGERQDAGVFLYTDFYTVSLLYLVLLLRLFLTNNEKALSCFE